VIRIIKTPEEDPESTSIDEETEKDASHNLSEKCE